MYFTLLFRDITDVSVTHGAWVRVVYSLNSLSWMVKYGRKSQQNFKGQIELKRNGFLIQK